MLTTTTRITRIDGGRNGRHYQVEGFSEPFPSVTTVLGIINKPALVPWARNVALDSIKKTLYEHLEESVEPQWVEDIIEQARRRPDQIRDQAADLGTRAHILIEQIIQGLEPEIPAEMEPLSQSMATEACASMIGKFIEQGLAWQEKFAAQVNPQMDAAYRGLNLPSRDQMDRMFERVIGIEERLDDLEKPGKL